MENDSSAHENLDPDLVTSNKSNEDVSGLQDYRLAYGLSRDPFEADPQYPFFTGANRRESLDQLLHLCQFGREPTLLVGEQGVGKTRLALAVREVLGQEQVCYLAALPTFDESSLVQLLIEYFDLESGESLAEISRCLAKDFQGEDGESNVLVVDEADHLADEVLLALVEQFGRRAAEASSPRLILSGTPNLTDRINGLLPDPGATVEVYLEPLALAEAVNYLNFRMEMADYLGTELFNEANTEAWWRQAQGSLLRLHKFARDYLFQTTVEPESIVTRRSFPIVHIVVMAALVSLVATLWLYREDKQDDSPFVDIGLPAKIKDSTKIEVVVSSPGIGESLPEEPELIEEASDLDAPMQTSVAETSLPTSLLEKTKAPPLEPQIEMPVKPVEGPSVSVRSTAAKKPVREAPQVKEAPLAQAVISDARVRSFSVDEQTLLSWKETDYTLQLLGVSTERAAVGYILAQPNRDELLMFRTLRQGKDWFVVVAGRFSDSASAKAAIENLPTHQARDVWVRSLGGIQADIRK